MPYRILFPCGAFLPRKGALPSLVFEPGADGAYKITTTSTAHRCDSPVFADGETAGCFSNCKRPCREKIRISGDDGSPYHWAVTCLGRAETMPTGSAP